MNKVFNFVNKYVETANYLLFAILYILSGVLIIVYKQNLFSNIVSIILLIMLLSCLKDLIGLIFHKNETKLHFSKILINIILVVISLSYVDVSVLMLTMFFSFYLLVNGVIETINFFIIMRNNDKANIGKFIEGLLYLIFGIFCFFSPIIHMNVLLTILGIYLILLGSSYLLDFLDQKLIHIKGFRIPLPPFFDVLIPLSVMQKIDNKNNNNKDSKDVILEIIVHVSEESYCRLGHVDICYKGNIISYGNYDKSTRGLKGVIGSGVVFVAPKEPYIDFCTGYSKEALFAFGIHMDNEQKKKFDKSMKNIFDSVVEWEPPYVKLKKSKKKFNEKEYHDYSTRLYKATEAKFYKFKSGRLKTFFLLGNNCGTWVEKILRSSGTGIFHMQGIVTPGTFYDFLEREYLKKDSAVVSKKIYPRK